MVRHFWDTLYVDIKKESQDRFLGEVVFKASKFASLIVTVGEDEVFVMDKLHDHAKDMFVSRSRKSLQVRPRRQTVSNAAVRSINMAPAFYFTVKLSLIS